MKSILYIVAIIAILAGAWFSYESKNKFEELQTQRKELDAKNENRKTSIRKAKKEVKEMEPGELPACLVVCVSCRCRWLTLVNAKVTHSFFLQCLEPGCAKWPHAAPPPG